MPTVIDMTPPAPGVGVAWLTDCHVTPDAAAMPLASRMNADSAGESGIANWSEANSVLNWAACEASRWACASWACNGSSFARSVVVSALTFDICERVGFRRNVYHSAVVEHCGKNADRKVLGLHGVTFASLFDRPLCAAGRRHGRSR